MKKIKIAQMQGEVNKIPANSASKIKDEFFKKDYTDHEIHEYEDHVYHVVMEARLFNTSTGQKMSNPKVQKFTPDNFKRLKEGGAFNGFTIHILHNPEKKERQANKLIDINGIGEAKEELLVKNGVKNIKQLADLTPIQIQELGDSVDGLSQEELQDFVEAAKEMVS